MWTKQIQDKLNEIVDELGLPKDSLRIEKNLLYAKGCQYRKNLEKGNAFLIDA